MDSVNEQIIKERTKKVFNFIKKKLDWVTYLALALVVFIGVWVRTRNLAGLRDVTTGGWTLGPDLDPFLFLRYAKYIVENGSLFAIDTMRYVPLGIATEDFSLHYYSIAWFHKLASFFGSVSVDQSASIFPVFMFAFTAIAFFFLSRKIIGSHFDIKYANMGAIISTLLLSLFPLFIPRSIAGIPEKESFAFLFMFLAFYFFMESWNNPNKRKRIIFAALAGISTGMMALIWGAYSYIFFIIVPATFISFLIGNFEKEQIVSYSVWIVSAIILMISFSNRYVFSTTFTSFDRGAAIALLFGVCFYHFVYHKIENSKIIKNKFLLNVPKRLLAVILLGAILVLISPVVFGPTFIFDRASELYSNFVRPATSRLIQTVAENRQPYFVEWAGNFGPRIGNFFVTLWLFIIGSISMFWVTLKAFPKKERVILTSSFAFMIFSIIFSRYSGSSILNGDNAISLFLYAIGMFAFCAMMIRSYYRANNKSELEKFKLMNVEMLIFFLFVFISLISARGFIRLVMIIVPPACIAIGYLGAYSIKLVKSSLDKKEKITPIITGAVLILAILFSAYQLGSEGTALARGYVPSAYNQQWQKAMQWVRDNTVKNAVFGHWWDYGYWIQSIGERATVLDGGNSIPYWNYLMGRHALTGSDLDVTLEFLYAHNTTHFLIDSSDIGKYSAFSTIGSDITYDRRSWIPSFLKDNSQTTERKNSTIFVYPGGTSVDEDINYNIDGKDLFLPAGKTYVAAAIISENNDGEISEVYAIYFFNEKTYQIPIRYYWDKKTGFVDTGKGIETAIVIYPRIVQNSMGGADIDPRGAVLYLSPRVAKTNLAKFYLYGQQNDKFKLVHSEQDFIVEMLKNQGMDVGDFVFYNEFRGPIKIWEINYPSNIKFNQSYLDMDYPDSIRLA